MRSASHHLRTKATGRWHPFRHTTLDQATLALLGFLYAFAVLAFGGVEAWSQLVIATVASLLAVLVLLRPLVDRNFTLRPNWMWLPCALLVVVAVVQLVPLPVGLVGWLSPERVEALAAHARAEPSAPLPEYLTLTVSPHETRYALRLVLVASMVLVAVSAYARSREHIEKLLLVVFGIGCAEAALALAQILTGAEKLYWLVDAGASGMLTAGSFVNHSHFSQFVNLAIGAGTGLLFIRLERQARKRRSTSGTWQVAPAELLQNQGWILAGLAVCVLAVCLSLSRNGILSLTVAAAVAGCLMARDKHLNWRGWVMSLVPLAVFVLLLVLGLDDFYERMGTLDESRAYADRWNLTRASIIAGSDYPLLGAGLGSYALVFPEYDTTGSASVAAYADNDYAQLFVEAGFTGLVILAVLAGAIAWAAWRAIRRSTSSAAQASFGLAAGLIAVAIHSATDFGQRLPAVFLLSVTVCGVLAALPRRTSGSGGRSSTRDRSDRPSDGFDPSSRTAIRWSSTAGAVLAIAAAVWTLAGAYRHYQAETWWAVAYGQEQRLRDSEWRGSEDDYERLLLAAENSVAWAPGDVEMRYWLNLYRWMSIVNLPVEDATAEEAMVALRPIVARIAEELTLLRRDCPTFHRPYLLEGQLRGYVLQETSAAGELFARAAELAKSDPEAQAAYGTWAAHQGQHELAVEYLSRAVAISDQYFEEAARVTVAQLGDVQAARQLAGEKLERMQSLEKILREQQEHRPLADELREEIQERLVQLAEEGAASAPQLAQLAHQAAEAGDHAKAVELYRHALGRRYTQFDWRLSLAQSLRELRQIESARREIRICLRLRPRDRRAKALEEALALEVEGRETTTP